MAYQLRNWYHFTWLCGDYIVEQHVHNLDVACWVIGDHPVSADGNGGQQVNRGPEFAESYDHFAVDYEFPNGVHVLSQCRQINGTDSDVTEYVVGTKGRWQARLPVRDGRRQDPDPGRRHQPLRPGAHRPAPEHRDRQADQRAQAGGREHAHGDHGPDVGLHRQAP